MRKILLAILALTIMSASSSCSDDDNDGNNEPERSKMGVPGELRAIHYGDGPNDIHGFNVYKLQPKAGSGDSQKMYEVRKYTARYDGNPSWDLDFLADNELEYNYEEGNYCQSEYYQLLAKDYNVSKYTNSMPKARYNSKGLVEGIGEYAGNVPNSWEINFTYDRDGKLIQSEEHSNLLSVGIYPIGMDIQCSFEWDNGNLVAIDRKTTSPADGMVMSQVRYKLSYSESPREQPSLFCLICNDIFDEQQVRIVDYDDFFADRYGLMTKDLLTGMTVENYDRYYPDISNRENYEYVINEENSCSYELTPSFDGQGMLMHYDVRRKQGTAADWTQLYAFDIKY